MHIARLVILSVCVTVLAGCADESPADGAPSASSATPTVAEEVRQSKETVAARFPSVGNGTFGWNASAGYDGTEFAAIMSDHAVTLQVPENASAAAFTIAWSCTVPQACSLKASVRRDGDDPSAVLDGDGRLTIELAEPQAGRWIVGLMSNGATAGVQGTVAWTVTGPRQP